MVIELVNPIAPERRRLRLDDCCYATSVPDLEGARFCATNCRLDTNKSISLSISSIGEGNRNVCLFSDPQRPVKIVLIRADQNTCFERLPVTFFRCLQFKRLATIKRFLESHVCVGITFVGLNSDCESNRQSAIAAQGNLANFAVSFNSNTKKAGI